MRLHLLYLFCLVGLTGCVNYAGMHGNATPFQAAQLSTPHVYGKTTKQVSAAKAETPPRWWNRFHDSTLNECITIALSDSPTMQIAQARIDKAIHLTEGAGAALWPSVNGNAYVERERFATFGLVPPPFNGRTFNIGDVALNFNYELDFWGKNRQILAAKLSRQQAAIADLMEARLVIAAAVTSSYVQLQSHLESLRIAKAIWRERQTVLSIIQDRARQGVDSDIPVKTAITDVEAARQVVYQFSQAEKISRHKLAVLMGKNPLETTLHPKPFIYQKRAIALPHSLPANLLAVRPDIIASRMRVEASLHSVNAQKARFFPNINLYALFSFQSVGLGRLFHKTNQNNDLGAAIDLPLFDAGLRRANLGVRYAEYDLAVHQYNRTILTALQEVADQLSILNALSAQLRAEQHALQAAKRHYKLSYSRYNHGIVDYVDVLQSKELLLQQQQTQVDLQARHVQAVVRMIIALGGSPLNDKDGYDRYANAN